MKPACGFIRSRRQLEPRSCIEARILREDLMLWKRSRVLTAVGSVAMRLCLTGRKRPPDCVSMTGVGAGRPTTAAGTAALL